MPSYLRSQFITACQYLSLNTCLLKTIYANSIKLRLICCYRIIAIELVNYDLHNIPYLDRIFIVTAVVAIFSYFKKHTMTTFNNRINMLTSKIKAKSLIGIGLASCVSAIAFQSPTEAQKVDNISQILVEVSDTINQQLPMSIDPTVRWDSTSAGPGKLMNYNYTLVGYSATEIDENQFANQFRPVVNNLLCNEPSSQVFRDNDVALNINVYDNSQSLVSRVKMSPSECE